MICGSQRPHWNMNRFLLGIISGQLHKHLLNNYSEPDVVLDASDGEVSGVWFRICLCPWECQGGLSQLERESGRRTCFEGRTGGSVHLKMNRMWSLTFKYFILYFQCRQRVFCSHQRAQVVEIGTVVKDRFKYLFPPLLGGSFTFSWHSFSDQHSNTKIPLFAFCLASLLRLYHLC